MLNRYEISISFLKNRFQLGNKYSDCTCSSKTYTLATTINLSS